MLFYYHDKEIKLVNYDDITQKMNSSVASMMLLDSFVFVYMIKEISCHHIIMRLKMVYQDA